MEGCTQLEENITLQMEEIQALTVIYGSDYEIVTEDNKVFSITLGNSTKSSFAQLEVTFQPEYPLLGPPVYSISAPWLSREQKQRLCCELENIYSDHFGESVVFMWIEKVREFMEKEAGDLNEDTEKEMLSNEPDTSLPPGISTANIRESKDSAEEKIPIRHGLPFTDRRSTFQAHLAAVKTVEEVKEVKNSLLTNKKIASATHNILAYRIYLESKNQFLQDCNDDGEAHAGSRLLHLLQILDVKDVMVVVSRWYGGIQLGPDRFKHINNVARSLLKDTGYIPEQKGTTEGTSGSKSKKKKSPK